MKFISVGADPEFFVLDPKGKPFPAGSFTAGTKNNPIPIGDGFFEQRDNVSLEGNIPPASSKDDFILNVTRLREHFINRVSKFGYSISNNGVEYFEKRYLNLPEAKEFGCSSVISAWDSNYKYVMRRPTPVLDKIKFRVSGFHIHIGYENPTVNMSVLIGRLFDLFLTLPSQVIKPEPERIQTYGKWGMIRDKIYGVECRTLSSFFTQKEWLSWVWDQLMKLEYFISLLSTDNLQHMIKTSYFVGSNDKRLKWIFGEIFNNFEDKKILDLFNETKEYYNEKHNKINPVPSTANFSNSNTNTF